MYLQTPYAPQIVRMLESAQRNGQHYVVFEMQPTNFALQPHQLDFYDNSGDALDAWDAKCGIGYLPGDNHNPVYYMSVQKLLSEVRQANSLPNQNTMNRNNLEVRT